MKNPLAEYSDKELRAELRRRLKNRKYYMAYRKGSKCVWGTGRSRQAARKDAMVWIKDWFSHRGKSSAAETKKLVTIQCSKYLYDDIRNYGGENVPFCIHSNMAVRLDR